MKKTYGDYIGAGYAAHVVPDFIRNAGLEKSKGTDLNQILGNVLQQRKDGSQPSVIRCDELPKVQGNEDKLSNTFQYILSFILSQPPLKATLFLYIKCEVARTDIIDMSIRSDEKKYRISFHTNSLADPRVFPAEQKEYCAGSLSEIKGKFGLNTETGTGGLFTLEVPGKLK